MAFWGENLSSGSRDPKRKFRFKVLFGGGEGESANTVVWWAKSVDKPKMTVESQEHKFMGHTFKYPGSVKWEDISLKLVDPIDPDTASQTLDILSQAGYVFPEEGYTGPNGFKTMSKAKATNALGIFQIVQLDAEGNTVATWDLQNAFRSSIQFSDLSYDSEELSEIDLTIMYDWAKFIEGSSDEYKFKFDS